MAAAQSLNFCLYCQKLHQLIKQLIKHEFHIGLLSCRQFGNSFICPTISGTTEIYIFGPAGAGIQNKICNIHLIDIVLQVQKYFEVQVFLVLQKYLEYQK